METIGDLIGRIIGLDAEELNVGQMAVRAIVVYISALLMVRLGEKRFFGRNTAFDFILGIILGSVVSRAINGSAAFFPALAAGLTLVLLHWLFSVLSFHSDWFGTLVKGNDRLLAENGAILWDAMRRSHLSEKDLMSSVRTQANVDDLEKDKAARLERSGDISVIKADASPKVLEVDVADGPHRDRVARERRMCPRLREARRAPSAAKAGGWQAQGTGRPSALGLKARQGALREGCLSAAAPRRRAANGRAIRRRRRRPAKQPGHHRHPAKPD